MPKLESFSQMQTKWSGLWWHPESGGFSSAAFRISDLQKFKGPVRLYIRKNKMYNKGENNRPNYNFTIKDANSPVFNLEIEPDDWTTSFDEYDKGDFIYGYEHYAICQNCGADVVLDHTFYIDDDPLHVTFNLLGFGIKYCPFCGKMIRGQSDEA